VIQQNDTFTLKELWLNKCFPLIITAHRLSHRPVWNHVESSALIRILIHDASTPIGMIQLPIPQREISGKAGAQPLRNENVENEVV
jgi:hypothetical protein